MIKREKILTCREMVRIEREAYLSGFTDLGFMECAGQGIARALQKRLKPRSQILLVCGKGNNAGDTYVVGSHLLSFGHQVVAHAVFGGSLESSLCQWQHKRFLDTGGKMVSFTTEGFDCILDGIFGTGFSGVIEEPLASIVNALNESGVPLFAIDIPSGLEGERGTIKTVAVRADRTFYVGFSKIGFFTQPGWEHTGFLEGVPFGLPLPLCESAQPVGWLITGFCQPRQLRTLHKYERGAAVGFVGSRFLPGAAYLSSLAALRSGTGIVSVLLQPSMESNATILPPEIVRLPFHSDFKANSLFIGCGISREPETLDLLQKLLQKTTLPTVIDADGLNLLQPDWQLPAQTIFTPHLGELKRLLKKEHLSDGECRAFCEEKKITLVRKGAPTVLFHPGELPTFNPSGHPAMATAGSGDVLTGIIASFLAQKYPIYDAAAAAVFLHGLAGQLAVKRVGPRSLIASDLIDTLGPLLTACDPGIDLYD